MNTSTEAKRPAQRPTPVLPARLTTMAKFLPAGATTIGGLVLSYEKTNSLTERLQECVLVIYALDDHTIHESQMCQTGPNEYEITGDSVIGTW
jgi:hypothetical protein